jgi:hypothetical protein
MRLPRHWLVALALLALIWGAVAVVMQRTDELVSWPGKVLGLLEDTPWLEGGSVSESERRLHLHRVITNLNRLEAAQRRSLREDGQEAIDRFFASLTPEEQKEYVNRTVEPYLKTLDAGLKRLPEEERKRLVARLRGDLRNLRGNSADGERLNDQDREFLELMIDEDPVLFLREAPLKVKMELAPVLEEMQSRLQGLRR